MPLYDYRCTNCHQPAAMLRSMAERNDPAVCTSCGEESLQLQISAPRSVIIKDGPFRAATPQQQLAGQSVTGPGTRRNVKSSVLHQCIGPNCSVCA